MFKTLELLKIKMGNLIKNYEEAKQALYDHVGFKEDWAVYPIDDCTDFYWFLDGDEEVVYAENRDDIYNDSGKECVDEIFHQRFYDKWVYIGEKYTMIFCNPGVDGMRWFRVFDNTKRVD